MKAPANPPRVLITGMSATGKSTVVQELRKLGFSAIDMDESGNSYRDAEGNQLWNEEVVETAIRNAGTTPLFISGCAENQIKFYPDLTDVVLFSAPRDVILERLAARTNNPYGKSLAESAEILRNLELVEPLLRRGATCEIDTSTNLADVVQQLLRCVRLRNVRTTIVTEGCGLI